MIAALKAEFLKLFTVRSTYVIMLLSLGLMGLTGGYIEGYAASPASLNDPKHLAYSVLVQKLPIVGLLIGILALIQFSHEYRYNTIMYTLTSTNSRSKLLGAKITVITLFTLLFMILSAGFALLATIIGVYLADKDLVSQVIPLGEVLWRTLLYGWAYAMLGLILVALVRSQVFALVVFFLFPATIEPLLGLLLKKNAVYLPYSAIDAIVNDNPNLSHGTAALVVLGYIVGFWILAWSLFVRRDAN